MSSELNVSGHIGIMQGGKMGIGKDAKVDVGGNVLNDGLLEIGESEVAAAFREAMQTTSDVLSFGKKLLDLLNLTQYFKS